MLEVRNSWSKTDRAIMYRLFAEQFCELVDKDTFDGYRVHTLSTPSKVEELREVSSQVIQKLTSRDSLELVVDEVNQAIRTDPVAADVLNRAGLSLTSDLISRSDSTERIESLSGLLTDLFEKEYQTQLEKRILDCIKTRKEKDLLCKLTKLYVAQIVNQRVSKEFLREKIKRTFTDPADLRCTDALLKRFLEQISSRDTVEHVVVFSASSTLASYMNENFKEAIYRKISDIPDWPGSTTAIAEKTGKNRKFLALKFNSRDEYSAVANAESYMSVIRSFIFLQPQGISTTLGSSAFVFAPKRSGLAKVIPFGARFDPRQHHRMYQPTAAPGNRLIKSIRNERGGQSIIPALSALSIAPTSRDPRVLLMSIWSALEAMLPTPKRDGELTNRIRHFVPLVVPSVCYDYLYRAFSECYVNCAEVYGDKFVDLVRSESKGSSDYEKLAWILAVDDDSYDRLFGVTGASPLLIRRFERLRGVLRTYGRLYKLHEEHESRVQWQIHRIYRERNSFVHSGMVSNYIGGLIENAYVYVRYLASAVEAAGELFSVFGAEKSLELYRIRYLQKLERIGSKELKQLPPFERAEKNIGFIFSDTIWTRPA